MANSIKAGNTFRAIQDVMNLFGHKTGNGRKPCYYRLGSGFAVWFPFGPRVVNGHLAPAKNKNWLNLLAANHDELAEICLLPPSGPMPPDKRRRAVFMKLDPAVQEYTFTGVYEQFAVSADGWVRLYRRIVDFIDPAASGDFIDGPDLYEPEDDLDQV